MTNDIVDKFTVPVAVTAAPWDSAQAPSQDAQRDPPRLKTGKEFVAEFAPPDWLVDGILQRGYFYSLTARTGHGKTAWALLCGVSVAAARKIGDRECRQGKVCFFAGENADDVRARLIAQLDHLGLDIGKVPIHFFDQIFDIHENANYIAKEVEGIGGATLIIIDSFAAFFTGHEENSNTEAGRYARELRSLCALPGKPTVLALAHPTKNATRENLLPRGGGAVTAEVDGNLRLWSEDFQTTELHWCGKLRGPDFEPDTFQMRPYTCAALTNDNGSYSSVIAVPMTQGDIERAAKKVRSNEDAVLDAMLNWPTGSLRSWCSNLEWINDAGEPIISRMKRTLDRLKEDKLAEKRRGRWTLTKIGKREAQAAVERGAL